MAFTNSDLDDLFRDFVGNAQQYNHVQQNDHRIMALTSSELLDDLFKDVDDFMMNQVNRVPQVGDHQLVETESQTGQKSVNENDIFRTENSQIPVYPELLSTLDANEIPEDEPDMNSVPVDQVHPNKEHDVRLTTANPEQTVHWELPPTFGVNAVRKENDPAQVNQDLTLNLSKLDTTRAKKRLDKRGRDEVERQDTKRMRIWLDPSGKYHDSLPKYKVWGYVADHLVNNGIPPPKIFDH